MGKAAAAKKGSNQDEDLEDEPNMERAAKKKGLDVLMASAWGKNMKAAGPKKFAELKAAVEKAAAAKKGSNQDEDLEWGKWGKDKKAAGAKKFAELKAAAPKKFAELKAAVEKAAAAKKGSNQ